MNTLNNLEPKELYDFQKEAYRANDMKAVKDCAFVARNRLKKEQVGGWEDAKNTLDGIKFPDGERGSLLSSGESHAIGRTSHDLESYFVYMKPILGYKVVGKYNICLKCRETRNKYFAMFNKKENSCYQKWFVKGGKNI